MRAASPGAPTIGCSSRIVHRRRRHHQPSRVDRRREGSPSRFAAQGRELLLTSARSARSSRTSSATPSGTRPPARSASHPKSARLDGAARTPDRRRGHGHRYSGRRPGPRLRALLRRRSRRPDGTVWDSACHRQVPGHQTRRPHRTAVARGKGRRSSYLFRLPISRQHGKKENCMPRIDVTTVPARRGSGYPKPFDAPCSERTRRRLGSRRASRLRAST